MRLRTDIWIQAYVRRCFVEGLWAAVSRKGDPDAGAVMVRLDCLDGTVRLYAPAPGGAFDDNGDRRWTELFGDSETASIEIAEYLEKQLRYDPDLWIVDVENRLGESLLSVS